MTHSLPELGYSYDALEPFIDAQTMEIHYSKHHQGYVNKLNAALENHSNLKDKDVNELLSDLDSIPNDIKSAVINNGGGHSNHSFFWKTLKKDVEVSGEIAEEIKKKFGSFEEFKQKFKDAATTLFGSGWAWLVFNPEKNELEIIQTKNQDSPISQGKIALIGLDVWEHAYYLNYKNKRPDYVEAFFNIINWNEVNKIFIGSKKS